MKTSRSFAQGNILWRVISCLVLVCLLLPSDFIDNRDNAAQAAGSQTWYISSFPGWFLTKDSTGPLLDVGYGSGSSWPTDMPAQADVYFPAATWTGHLTFFAPMNGSYIIGIAKFDSEKNYGSLSAFQL